MKQKSTWNVKSHRINEILQTNLKKNITLLKMNDAFRKTFLKTYEKNNQWKKIIVKIKFRQNEKDTFDDINFVLKKNTDVLCFEKSNF